MKKINTLGLFDGMSNGRISLDISGFNIGKYQASEVDKHAINASMAMYPETEQIGDVRDINEEHVVDIDLLIGGSPCQSFSFSGKANGMTTESKEEILTLDRYLELKSAGFKFKGQSYLFWEFVRVLGIAKAKNPNVVWMLENVVMSKKWEGVINEALGVNPTMIDSTLVSGQQRKRLYWTNAYCDQIPQPEDRGINLHDLLEIDGFDNSGAIRGRYLNKATIVGRRLNSKGARDDYNKSIPITQCIEVRRSNTNKSNCITTVQKDNILTNLPFGRHPGAFSEYIKDEHWRYLTAREALRLQTVPESNIEIILAAVSESQAYKMAGNGWTVEVIVHILSNSPKLQQFKM